MADSLKEAFADVCPWPYLVATRTGGIVRVSGNLAALLEVEPAVLEKLPVDKVASPEDGGLSWEVLFPHGVDSEDWEGRVKLAAPGGRQLSMHMLARHEAGESGRLWLIAMENPVIGGKPVWSSSSEMNLLQAIMRHTADFIFVKDRERRFMLTNASFARFLDLPTRGFEVGKTVFDFYGPEDAERVDTEERKIIETGEPVLGRRTNIAFGGREICVMTSKVPILDPQGTVVGLVGIGHDITTIEQKERELEDAKLRAELASKAKTEFLASVSHELRTPLNGVIGLSELLLDTELTQKQRGLLEGILNCGNTLISLINDVLDLSRIECGKLELEPQPFELPELLRGLHREFENQAKQKGLTFHLKIGGSLPATVSADALRLKQILYNLLSNAVKFTESGTVELAAREERRQGRKCWLSFLVRDTGIGIPRDMQAEIFHDYTQSDQTISRRFGGSGLGLAITKRLLNAFEGEIKLRSEVGKGTEFRILLPVTVVEDTLEAKAPTREAQPNRQWRFQGKGGRAPRVMLVDDNPINEKLCRSMLEKMGCRCDSFFGGAEAVAHFCEDADYDLILMDIQMPEVDGLEASRAIREWQAEHGGGGRVSIAALTARALSADREVCLQAGMDGFLAKPYRQEDLAALLEELLGSGDEAGGSSFSDNGKSHGSLDLDELPASYDWEQDSLLRTEGLEWEDVRELMEIFVAQTEEAVDDLSQAIEKADFEQLKITAHGLKGIVGVFNARRAYQLAVVFEKEVERGRLDQLGQLLTMLRDEIEGIRSQFTALLEEKN